MSNKIKVKAYLVISPDSSERPSKENIYFGGVAGSCAIETAGEEGGFVVTLEGEYDKEQVVEMYEEQVYSIRRRLEYETIKESRFWSHPKNPEKQAKLVMDTLGWLKDAEESLEKARQELV
jgi:hypothetical protein